MIIVIGINTHEGNDMETNNQTDSFNLKLDAVLYPDAPDSFEDTGSGKLILDQNELPKADQQSSDPTSKLLNHPYAKKILGIVGGIIFLSILVNLSSCGDDYNPNYISSDPQKALEYHHKYCNKNVARACNTVISLSTENGQDYEACRAAQKSCALNDPIGCGLLGIYYYLNDQTCVNRDLNKAIKYLKMSCDTTGSYLSCWYAALAIGCSISENRLNATSEKFDEMKQYLIKACGLGSKEACSVLQKSLKNK